MSVPESIEPCAGQVSQCVSRMRNGSKKKLSSLYCNNCLFQRRFDVKIALFIFRAINNIYVTTYRMILPELCLHLFLVIK